MLVAINRAIDTRGISGTSRGLAHLRAALCEIANLEAVDVWPRHGMRRSRVWNATAQASWDLYYAARSIPSAEVFVSPCNIGRSTRGQGHLLVLHDTMVLDCPELFDSGYARYARALFSYSVSGADAILVPSIYTKNRIASRWPGAPPIVVGHWPLVPTSRSRISSRSRDILMVGATEPHKRQAIGVRAVALARKMSGEDLRLTILGPVGRAERRLEEEIKAVDPSEAWIARKTNAPESELLDLYRSAWVLLQPSEMEGYGLPVGEAASAGIPVLHSGKGALSEIAPKTVEAPDDAGSYAAEICMLLDEQRYSNASAASLAAAGGHNTVRFAESVAQALSIVRPSTDQSRPA